jgi:hypothetical protein
MLAISFISDNIKYVYMKTFRLLAKDWLIKKGLTNSYCTEI